MKNVELKLIKKAKQGDKQAFGKLVLKYQDKVFYLAFDITNNSNDAQDIAQNTFLQIYQKLCYFREESSFSTWLYRITTNASIDFLRKKNKQKGISLNQPNENGEKNYLIDTLEDKSLSIEKKFEDRDLKDLISETLDMLSPRQKAAFVLRYYHNKKSDEIAEILECNAKTVRSHILRATIKLRKFLEDEK